MTVGPIEFAEELVVRENNTELGITAGQVLQDLLQVVFEAWDINRDRSLPIVDMNNHKRALMCEGMRVRLCCVLP